MNPPKVFISYSWEPVDNKVKTIALAERLVTNGVDVVIDVWDLKEGQDKYRFMERMVNSPEISRVLIICNKVYKDKADLRKGGVGSESMIISDKIYSNAEQTKFLPIIFEKNQDNKPYLPTYVSSLIYIDLSDEEYFENEYEKLLRNLFEKPIYEKPKLGSPPIFLISDEKPTKNHAKISTIKNSLINEKKYTEELILDYFNTVIEDLKSNVIDLNHLTDEIDEVVLKKISELRSTKDEFLELVKIVSRYSKDKLPLFHKFFEKGLDFLISQETFRYPSGTLGAFKNDHYYFIFYELFLSTSCLLFEKDFFNELAYLLHTPFVVFSESKKDYLNLKFVNLSCGAQSLNQYRIQRLKLNSVNGTTQLILERSKGIFKNEYSVQNADKLLYYVSCINAEFNQSRIWFPFTCTFSSSEFIVFKKLKSTIHFNLFKKVLNVESKEELVTKLKNVAQNRIDEKIDRYNYQFEYLEHLIDIDKICMNP
jgi:hypothetical protein